MTDEISLVKVDIGDIAKPTNTFIEKISSAIGVIYEPHRLIRRAKAEADVAMIRALSEIEVSDVQKRAMQRMVAQETRKQENIEDIISQAAEDLTAESEVENLDEDWVAHFFKQCETISNKQMQSLWSKLLSGEANKPGTYSKRTVDFISTMDKTDAEMFTRFCTFVWMIGAPTPLIMDSLNDIYTQNGVDFNTLTHLDSIGLISFNFSGGYQKTELEKYIKVFYYGQPTTLEFGTDRNNLEIGNVILTKLGAELVSLCEPKQNDEFHQYILNIWSSQNIILSTPIVKN